jgi:putative phosphoribosyl transferase
MRESRPLSADIVLPEIAWGIIVFAHGSGSSRLSPRNRHVASELNHSGFGTVLFDLLTEDEAADRRNVFNIPLLGHRMAEAVAYVHEHYPRLPTGLFGASTGAAAALHAAARHHDIVKAVVSRGGRPDLALNVLAQVRAPTLLIVGGSDEPVIELNRMALAGLHCQKRLEIIPGATHLFEERGALDHVIELATDWFIRYLKQEAVT